MRWVRIEHEGAPHYALCHEDGSATLHTAAPWAGGQATATRVPLDAAQLLAPVTPSKVLCVGRNYAAHARELGHEMSAEPLLFLKAPSAVIGPGDDIVLPAQSVRVEYEGELGLVIGRRAKDLEPGQVRDVLFGVTAVNDVTARDLQRSDVQFARAKSFDTFCPVGPCIDTDWNLASLEITTRLNGEVRQHAHVEAMAFPILELVAYMSKQMTLLPGDLICTGTPEGVGALQAGDQVAVQVSGLPVLVNTVREA